MKNYSLRIEYSPVYELISSFYAYINKKELKFFSLHNKWREETKSKLPNKYADELENEQWEVLHRTVLLVSQCPDKETVEGFLKWFGQLPAGELYERLVPWVQSIPLNLGEIRDRSFYLLSEWNEYYFQHFDSLILSDLKRDAEHKKEKANEIAPIDLIEQVTNGIQIEPTEHLQHVVLVPQFHCRPTTILDFHKGMATCLYPIKEVSTIQNPNADLLQLTTALADEKRLRIVRFIAKKPRTLTEIHQHIGLAKSTVHHHLMTLRRAGIIRSHCVGSTTVAYYSLREVFIDVLNEKVNRLLSI
ncbi:ArsR/SmtB family transcription factor [Melghirimyces algeriensis]|uniref:Regulatory protein, arsR family n=1 Tax=Melghirimyces algeriensis TaxID=910412 RepID=A0A521CL50_9BACL|nr:winged helix-turn-helix domain-containing protein [Melghirimyces algeriensis]SMO60158.1 regulatory protein, arsR family [Melghirimyces algeriensis]